MQPGAILQSQLVKTILELDPGQENEDMGLDIHRKYFLSIQ